MWLCARCSKAEYFFFSNLFNYLFQHRSLHYNLHYLHNFTYIIDKRVLKWTTVKLSMLKPDGKVEHNNEARWKRYQCHFESPHNERFVVENSKFYHKRAKILSLNFKRWKTKDKSQYIDHFSHENWKDLPELEKKQHQRVDCQACAVHHDKFQTLFPSWGRKGYTS